MVCQLESGVLSEDAARKILSEFDRTDRTVAQIWGLIQNRHDDPTDDFNIWFASELAPLVDPTTRLVRVAPLGAILARLDRSRSGEIELIQAELNRLKPLVDGDPRNQTLLDDCEQQLHELFDGAADAQHRAGLEGFGLGAMSWLNVSLTTNIKLSTTAEGIPTFCTTSSARHRELEIFASRGGAADRARDILGLAPFDNTYNDSVVAFGAMAFSPKDLEGQPAFARPTMADLVDRKRFKGVYGELSGATDFWGRAVDLGSVATGRPHRGGREVVVAARRPTALHVAFLGYLRLPRSDVYVDRTCDTSFENLLTRGRTKDQFMNIVCM